MQCHQAVFGSCHGCRCPFSKKSPKERTFYFWENTVELDFYLRRKYLLTGIILLLIPAVSHNVVTYQRFLLKNPLYRAWNNK